MANTGLDRTGSSTFLRFQGLHGPHREKIVGTEGSSDRSVTVPLAMVPPPNTPGDGFISEFSFS